MRVMTLGQAPPLAATPRAKLEAWGYVLAGVASALGLVLMATKRQQAGYAVLISTVIVGTAWSAVRTATTP